MRGKIAVAVIVLLVLSTTVIQATPKWLEGVPVPWPTVEVKPVYPAEIYMADGSEFPATFTEDVPVHLIVDSKIFDDEPPTEYQGQPLHNSRWYGRALVHWFFTDWETHTKSIASTSMALAVNEMYVTPIDPTSRGAVEVFISRRMEYEPTPGETTRIFVNSSRGRIAAVEDITPPTCGLEVIVGDHSGVFWAVESPANHYPLPKFADVIFEGDLFCPERSNQQMIISRMELGDQMLVDVSQAAVYVSADDELSFLTILHDNYKLDEESVRFGISDGADEQPSPIGPVNADIDLSEYSLPEEPYIFIEAKDVSGNRQLMYVPLIVR